LSSSRPQNDWESFSPIASIPKGVKGVIPLPTETIRSNRMEPEAERLVQGGKTVEVSSPQQKIPQRRGRPRKNKEVEEAQVSEEPHARSVAEELLMRAIRLEPARGSSRESRRRTRKMDITGANDQEPSQQLK
jgi:hypothetical protein